MELIWISLDIWAYTRFVPGGRIAYNKTNINERRYRREINENCSSSVSANVCDCAIPIDEPSS